MDCKRSLIGMFFIMSFIKTSGSLNFSFDAFCDLNTRNYQNGLHKSASFDFQTLILKYFVHLALYKLKHINRRALKVPHKVEKGR